MLPLTAIAPLALFTALMLALSLLGLTAAGHFPRAHRVAALRGVTGTLILFGALAIGAVCLASGVIAAWQRIPWYAAVIGGGAVVLLAPLVLQVFPDSFVDGRAALVVFSLAAAVAAGAIWLT